MTTENTITEFSQVAEKFIKTLQQRLIEKEIPLDGYEFKVGTDQDFGVGNSGQFGVFRENSNDGSGIFYPIKQ